MVQDLLIRSTSKGETKGCKLLGDRRLDSGIGGLGLRCDEHDCDFFQILALACWAFDLWTPYSADEPMLNSELLVMRWPPDQVVTSLDSRLHSV